MLSAERGIFFIRGRNIASLDSLIKKIGSTLLLIGIGTTELFVEISRGTNLSCSKLLGS